MNISVPVVISSEVIRHVDPRSLAEYRSVALNAIDPSMFSLSRPTAYENEKFGLIIRFQLLPLDESLNDADSFLMIWRDRITHKLIAGVSVLPKGEGGS